MQMVLHNSSGKTPPRLQHFPKLHLLLDSTLTAGQPPSLASSACIPCPSPSGPTFFLPPHVLLHPFIYGLPVLYALYIAYNHLFTCPPNLFTSLSSCSTPPKPQVMIHVALLWNPSHSDNALPLALEKLFTCRASLNACMMLVQ